MSFADIIAGFRQGASPAAQRVEPPPPATGATSNTTVPSAATPTPDGSNPAIPAPGTGDKSPLDGYKELWQAPDPTTVAPPISLTPSMDFDPAKLMESAKGIDFSKAMDPATLALAAKGDPAALSAIINSAGQAGFAHSVGATANLIKAALEKQGQTLTEKFLPDLLAKHQSRLSTDLQNPIFSNPVISPIVTMLRDQVQTKFPTATAEQVAEHVGLLMNGMAKEVIKGSGGTVTDKAPTDSTSGGLLQALGSGSAPQNDWSNYFNVR